MPLRTGQIMFESSTKGHADQAMANYLWQVRMGVAAAPFFFIKGWVVFRV